VSQVFTNLRRRELESLGQLLRRDGFDTSPPDALETSQVE
jgi:hypothetical protein